ncbi:MAG: M3 family oligoendopeptidase [Leptolyngbyaceae bacterium]|nr:M3 family oligoendopeptidase [Leptolyngbyaceae bacterium]
MTQLQQTWDNRQFFSGSDDPRIATVVDQLKQDIQSLGDRCLPFIDYIDQAEGFVPGENPEVEAVMGAIASIHRQRIAVIEQQSNLGVFISSSLSVDTQDKHAAAWLPTLQQLGAERSQALQPLNLFLMRVPDAFITTLLVQPGMDDLAFYLTHQRRRRDFLLSVAEEKLITGLAVNGLHSWGNLYDDLAGDLKCDIEGKSVGLAKAANLLSHPQRQTREAAWQGIRSAWISREKTAATLLNSINGWRLEEAKYRSHIREMHYLDKSCHESCIERQTLDTLMATTYEQRSIGQRALKAMAQVLEIDCMAPWDQMAPAPAAETESDISFEEAIALIAAAFSRLSPEMGEFAVMMAEQGWIDAQPTPNRTTGAYCTGFSTPREPRIFITYEGTMTNVMTLAHELGHAWHNWVMRDLPIMQTSYPMTLAETASIFAETLVRDALLAKANTPAEKLAITWQNAQSAASLLVNIPARFEFEKRLVEARKTGFVVADALKQMMADSWQVWYEDSLSSYDDMFWASKLHFSISQIGFYNYPYLFGYLFSLGLYAQQETYGDRFNQLYIDLLRDTGRMTAEAVVQKHLQQDICQPEFWQASLAIVDGAVRQFEQLVNEMHR